jgi:hypothetical protein
MLKFFKLYKSKYIIFLKHKKISFYIRGETGSPLFLFVVTSLAINGLVSHEKGAHKRTKIDGFFILHPR